MAEHEHEQQSAAGPAKPLARQQQAPTSLPSAIGNRAMARMIQRMEVADATKALEDATKPGTLGAGHQVTSTLAAFSRDTVGFDKVALEYQKKTEQPLMRQPEAASQAPASYFQGISGEQFPELKKDRPRDVHDRD